ncbi:MAG: EAL domain-containing protein, partial [Bacillota bacterium]|nr:EAL domain-containing protein [Bacillota bacterium]
GVLDLVTTALYTAKKLGKNTYFEFKQDNLAEIDRKAHVLDVLKKTIKNNSFELHYQPYFNIQTGELVAFEALCRVVDGNDYIAPEEFIKIAEDNNVIWEVDKSAMAGACKMLAVFQDMGIRTGISVNVSPISFMNQEFIPEIEKLLKRYKIFTNSLMVELTETAFIESFSRAKDVITALSELGIRLMLDDFGKGYSNLLAVMKLNVDTLKFDKSLIDEIEDIRSNIIVKKMIEIADTFNMKVIAEGIETRMQFEELKRMNCTMGQGFLFGKPMAYEEVFPFIRSHGNILDLAE